MAARCVPYTASMHYSIEKAQAGSRPVLLLTGEVARICGVSPETVRLWSRSGRLVPSATTESGVRLFARDDVDRIQRERGSSSVINVA